MFPRSSAFSPPADGSRPHGLPPKPAQQVVVTTRQVGSDEEIIAHNVLESWYNALNDLHDTRTSARIPAAISEAIADVRDSIYGYLR